MESLAIPCCHYLYGRPYLSGPFAIALTADRLVNVLEY